MVSRQWSNTPCDERTLHVDRSSRIPRKRRTSDRKGYRFVHTVHRFHFDSLTISSSKTSKHSSRSGHQEEFTVCLPTNKWQLRLYWVSFWLLHYKGRGHRETSLRGAVKDGLYLLNQDNKSPMAYAAEKVTTELWHQRLGHPHFKTLHRVISTFGLPTLAYNKSPSCDACSSSKSHKLPYAIW